jgi:quinoprotein dehydrogenase-associated probable ABC transporter substrate-binding protein
MMKYGMLLPAIAALCSLAPARAEMTGQEKIQASKTEFRVCADPDNLPFSNRQGKGFENKIAEMLARSAGQPLVYYWWPTRRGFINKTLNAWECDIVLGVPTGYELTTTTQPYYCSRYVMVYRPGERLSPSLLDEPGARSLRIGVVEQTPPLDLALRHNLDPVVYFTNYDYVSNFPGRIVADVATRKLDVALVWGPVGGYFARLQLIPLRTAVFENPKDPPARLAFPVSFGVRRGDKARAERLEALMHEHAGEIEAILRDNGIPLVDDPTQCAPPPPQQQQQQHASSNPALPVQLIADVTTPSDTDSPRVETVADQTSQSQASGSNGISCKGTETLEDVQKLAGGPPPPGHPYVVQNGKADSKTYSGWVRFAAFCQVCHGTGGVGSAIAPSLTQALKTLNQRQFETIVSCGLKGNQGTGVMPAWGTNPNIEPYLEVLWAYLSARADGALGPGRPEKLGTSK